MKITIVPPCQIVDAHNASSGTKNAHLHMRMWLLLRLEDWDVQRSTHLHFMRPLGGDRYGENWRRVDLTSHPLQRVVSAEIPPIPEWIEESVTEWIDELEVEFFRAPNLELVSELWESEDEFRQRIRGMVRPEVRRQIEELNTVSPSRFPWRRAAAATARKESKERLADGISRLVGGLERRRVRGFSNFTRCVEVRVLLVPEGYRLQSQPRRERMIDVPEPR
jgi:hypothetical protein